MSSKDPLSANVTRSGLIRDAKLADAPAIARIYNHAITNTTATFDIEPKTATERRAWLATHDARHPVVVLESNGQVVGWGCLSAWSERTAYADTAESTVYVDPAGHGQGYGGQLQQALLQRARTAGLHTLLARIAEGSAASIRLHERCGFERVGTMREVGKKFGQLLDVHLYQIIL